MKNRYCVKKYPQFGQLHNGVFMQQVFNSFVTQS
ncbi:hypothetical protein CK203_068022 [Vitis vinifera]|uniref:Uncharacterized protein n=1 Tax=Vitis vinifera TaxID=29760 RepID=A0A438EWB7_VITVI|nr:hypothetical protein CK203_068022 [Vitis vinifera]